VIHALLVSSEEQKAPAKVGEIIIYDSEALDTRSTTRALQGAQHEGYVLCIGKGLWTPTMKAMDRRQAFEDRFLEDTDDSNM
jgi:hypothetical protein